MAKTLTMSTAWVTLIVVHLVAAAVMAGIIWTIHVVHYPLFANVGEAAYPAYQSAHMSRITALLALPWLVEIGSAVGLLVMAPTAQLRVLAGIGLGLVGLILVVTAFGAAPIHGKLIDGFDADLHGRLLFWDLVRTLAWTARVGIGVALVVLSVVARAN